METKQNFIIWSALVAVPMLIGPILTAIMEFILYLGKKCSKVVEYLKSHLILIAVVYCRASSLKLQDS